MFQDPLPSSHPIPLPTGLSLNRSFFQICCVVTGSAFLSTISQSFSKWSTAALQFIFHFFVLIQTLRIPLKTFHHTLELLVDIKPITLHTVL